MKQNSHNNRISDYFISCSIPDFLIHVDIDIQLLDTSWTIVQERSQYVKDYPLIFHVKEM